ncbi:senescence-associated carboxylesterase 101-like [Prosopis cineraria]|uniref:senescence-associated carboxylesterase 101-like n=1 Tax=Prosopis cineraria TaxID=364024 RepID=UPI0024105B29|nr:senescence-associated carboxylesterase 101-like [Prosopis cineraria]
MNDNPFKFICPNFSLNRFAFSLYVLLLAGAAFSVSQSLFVPPFLAISQNSPPWISLLKVPLTTDHLIKTWAPSVSVISLPLLIHFDRRYLSEDGASDLPIKLHRALIYALELPLHQICSIDLKKPVIVTGHAIGGSIASLFTLLLLEDVRLAADKRPLCITFGSPLLGDQNLQQALSRSSYWNSCSLHVTTLHDPFLSCSISHYRPFGIFILCSNHGSACFESPDSILKLKDMVQPNQQGLQIHDYENIVENLNRNAICEVSNVPNISHSNELQENLVKELHKQEMLLIKKKSQQFNPDKKLNDMKTNMAGLEWYKKRTKNERKGYYDSYKDGLFPRDQDAIMLIKVLNDYWEDMVQGAEKQPQKEGKKFCTKWLYGGTNYRRMVEPLDIAQYYKEGKRDYIKQKWLEYDPRRQPGSISGTNIGSILTLDSCSWAHVEEAVILTQNLKTTGDQLGEAERREAVNSLDEFENYVYGSLKKHAVSSEIFLTESSFMC